MRKCPYNLDGYCYAFNKKCSEQKECVNKQIIQERKKS